MKKVAIALAICLVALVASAAFAAAVKIDLTNVFAEPNHPDAVGKAVLNYAKGADKTEIQVNCSGLIAGDDYVVYLEIGVGVFTHIGEFTAGPNGKGTFHARLDGDVSAYPVAVNSGLNLTVLYGP